MAQDIRMKNPAHPGGFVKTEIIEPLGLSVTDAAQVLGITRAALSAFLNERASLSPDMAIRIQKAFSVSKPTGAKGRFRFSPMSPKPHRQSRSQTFFDGNARCRGSDRDGSAAKEVETHERPGRGHHPRDDWRVSLGHPRRRRICRARSRGMTTKPTRPPSRSCRPSTGISKLSPKNRRRPKRRDYQRSCNAGKCG